MEDETNFINSADQMKAKQVTEMLFNKSGQNLDSPKEKFMEKLLQITVKTTTILGYIKAYHLTQWVLTLNVSNT